MLVGPVDHLQQPLVGLLLVLLAALKHLAWMVVHLDMHLQQLPVSLLLTMRQLEWLLEPMASPCFTHQQLEAQGTAVMILTWQQQQPSPVTCIQQLLISHSMLNTTHIQCTHLRQ